MYRPSNKKTKASRKCKNIRQQQAEIHTKYKYRKRYSTKTANKQTTTTATAEMQKNKNKSKNSAQKFYRRPLAIYDTVTVLLLLQLPVATTVLLLYFVLFKKHIIFFFPITKQQIQHNKKYMHNTQLQHAQAVAQPRRHIDFYYLNF